MSGCQSYKKKQNAVKLQKNNFCNKIDTFLVEKNIYMCFKHTKIGSGAQKSST